MLELVLIVCLSAKPDKCETIYLRDPGPGSMMQCLYNGAQAAGEVGRGASGLRGSSGGTVVTRELTRIRHRWSPPLAHAEMPGLLASVATLDEVEDALAFGADLIDLKDPSRGALGPGPPALLGRRGGGGRATASGERHRGRPCRL